MASTAHEGARGVAQAVLVRVWQDGSWAAPALDAELSRARLDERDRAFATELVFGVLRTSRWLEGRVAAHAGDRWRKKPAQRAAMLVAVYQLAFLDRVPGFAAVDTAVGQMKRLGGRRLGGFANAVLRRVAGELEGADRPALRREAAAASIPGWLRLEVTEAVGAERAAAFFARASDRPEVGLRLRPGEDRSAWIERLREAAPKGVFEPGTLSTRAMVALCGGQLARLPGHGAAWDVQDQGSQAVAEALGVERGHQVLDACAGRGNKTRVLCELSDAVEAADLYPDKLARLRLAAPAVRGTFAVDWTVGSGELRGRLYDRILCDAPCTGVGTLGRRPEILHRLAAADPDRMAALQLAILQRVAVHLAPGGRLLYAVCSPLAREGEAVIAASGLSAVEPPRRLCGGEHATDGYFYALLSQP